MTSTSPSYAYRPAAGGARAFGNPEEEEAPSESPVEGPIHSQEVSDAWEAALNLPTSSEWEQALAPPDEEPVG